MKERCTWCINILSEDIELTKTFCQLLRLKLESRSIDCNLWTNFLHRKVQPPALLDPTTFMKYPPNIGNFYKDNLLKFICATLYHLFDLNFYIIRNFILDDMHIYWLEYIFIRLSVSLAQLKKTLYYICRNLSSNILDTWFIYFIWN
jgi:hypothetical protein